MLDLLILPGGFRVDASAGPPPRARHRPCDVRSPAWARPTSPPRSRRSGRLSMCSRAGLRVRTGPRTPTRSCAAPSRLTRGLERPPPKRERLATVAIPSSRGGNSEVSHPEDPVDMARGTGGPTTSVLSQPSGHPAIDVGEATVASRGGAAALLLPRRPARRRRNEAGGDERPAPVRRRRMADTDRSEPDRPRVRQGDGPSVAEERTLTSGPAPALPHHRRSAGRGDGERCVCSLPRAGR